MYQDRQRLSPLSESLIQRYILVLFYFMTTDNEATPWKSCNRPRFNEDAACDFQHFTRSPLDDSIIFEPEGYEVAQQYARMRLGGSQL